MRYLIDIRLHHDKKRTYRIEANNEEEAKERLKLRLSPSERETVVFDAIRVDSQMIALEEPYGSFGGE